MVFCSVSFKWILTVPFREKVFVYIIKIPYIYWSYVMSLCEGMGIKLNEGYNRIMLEYHSGGLSWGWLVRLLEYPVYFVIQTNYIYTLLFNCAHHTFISFNAYGHKDGNASKETDQLHDDPWYVYDTLFTIVQKVQFRQVWVKYYS